MPDENDHLRLLVQIYKVCEMTQLSISWLTRGFPMMHFVSENALKFNDGQDSDGNLMFSKRTAEVTKSTFTLP